MLIGSVAMVCILVQKAGGFFHAVSTLPDVYAQHVPAAKAPGAWLLVSLVFMTSFGPWGLPQMVQKFYAIRNERVIPVATIVTSEPSRRTTALPNGMV